MFLVLTAVFNSSTSERVFVCLDGILCIVTHLRGENTLTAVWAGMEVLRNLSIREIISIYFFHFMFYILLTFVSISENPAENHENPGLTYPQGPQDRGCHNWTGITGSSEERSNLTLSYSDFFPLTLSYPSSPNTRTQPRTHRRWWGRQPPSSEQPGHPWWKQQTKSEQESDGRGKKRERKCTVCKSPSPCCCRGADFLPSKQVRWMGGGWGGWRQEEEVGTSVTWLSFLSSIQLSLICMFYIYM